jgi:hypothetical protein
MPKEPVEPTNESTRPESADVHSNVPIRGPAFAASEPHVQDLSREIAAAVSKEPGEQVTCRRISGHHYRCNWWAAQSTSDFDNPRMYGPLVTTHRIARSHLLRVTKTATGLVIDESAQR